MDKILQFEKNQQTYLRLADKCLENKDYKGALGYLFSAEDAGCNYEIYKAIADVYFQMEMYEQSNKYLFKFILACPKYRASEAYEDLAVNLFYLGEYMHSSYYFNKKLEETGVLDSESLDPEILDFFSGMEEEGDYYVAYPPEKADYTPVAKKAKRAMTVGDLNKAIGLYESIPVEKIDADGVSELSVCYLMTDNPDKALALAKDFLKTHGDSVAAFCSLSNAYTVLRDNEKSDYYYNKALECEEQRGNEYKLLPCAVERQDHEVILRCLEKISEDRPFDLTMRFFYGLAKLNLGNAKGAYEELAFVYKLDPFNQIYKFYAEYASRLDSGALEVENYLPVKYLERLPEKVEEQYKSLILSVAKNSLKVVSSLKKDQVKKAVEWGIKYSTDDFTVRNCVFILASSFTPYAKSVIKGALTDNNLNPNVKQLLIYACVVNGVKEKIQVVDCNVAFDFKAKRLKCEKKEKSEIFLAAYALAVSRLAFAYAKKIDKLADAMDRVYDVLCERVEKYELDTEIIAALAVWLCKFERLSKQQELAQIFNMDYKLFDSLKDFFSER